MIRRRGLIVVTVLMVAVACGGTEATAPAVSPVVSPVATTETDERCRQLGYPCSWNEAGVEAFERTRALAGELQTAVDDAASAPSGLLAALEILKQRDDVVEIKLDDQRWTGMFFRLEGSPPGVVGTELAGPVPSDEDVERVPVPDIEGSPTPNVGADVRSDVRLARYHPTGGPSEDRAAAILDPYYTKDLRCEEDDISRLLGHRNACRRTASGGLEGDFLRQLFRSNPDYTDVAHFKDAEVTPSLIAQLPLFDAIHIISHGTTACTDHDPAFNYTPQAGECVTQTALGPFAPGVAQQLADGSLTVGAGFAPDGVRWWMLSNVLADLPLGDSIVFANHCTSLDGALNRATFGGVIGWRGYAVQRSATDAAIRFWDLMIGGGVEFDVAWETLRQEGLHISDTYSFEQHMIEAMRYLPEELVARWLDWRDEGEPLPQATLAAGGKNYRARDVIVVGHDDPVLGSIVKRHDQIRTVGTPGDGASDRIAALTVLIDGVADDTASDATVELFIDGQPLSRTYNLERDGVEVDRVGGDSFSKRRLDLTDIDIGFDLTAADVDAQNPRPHSFEARVYEDSRRYSAFKVDPVYFAAVRVTLRNPANSARLEDGAELRIRGRPGDGVNDQLAIMVDVAGVTEPGQAPGPGGPGAMARGRLVVDYGPPANRYYLRFFVGDNAEHDIEFDNLGNARAPTASVTQLDDTTYRYTYIADLPFDVDPDGTPTVLKVVVESPAGPAGHDKVGVTLVGSPVGAVITIGSQTWVFESTEWWACYVSEGSLAAGDLNTEGAEFSAALRADGGSLTLSDGLHPPLRWTAHADREGITVMHLLPAGLSQIDTITIEGGRARGTATFIETGAVNLAWSTRAPWPAPVSGTFDIQCAE